MSVIAKVKISQNFDILAKVYLETLSNLAAVAVSQRYCHWVESDRTATDFYIGNLGDTRGKFGRARQGVIGPRMGLGLGP